MLRKFALTGFEPGPSVRTSVHWTTSVNSNNLSFRNFPNCFVLTSVEQAIPKIAHVHLENHG